MAADVLAFDPLKNSAYSNRGPAFDLAPRHGLDPVVGAADVTAAEAINPELDLNRNPPKRWEIDVRGLISTKQWLMNYGLKRNRLDMFHLLPQIGFKHSDDYDPTLKRPIPSRYGTKLFQRFQRADGSTYNLTMGKDKLVAVEQRLQQAIKLYRRRLNWLTSESRRIFGVVEEKSVCIVMDICNMSPQQFDQYRVALERVLREQVSQIAKFNIIRATEDVRCYNEESVPVTSESIESAIKWLWSLKRTDSVSKTATCEAVLKALCDNQVEAVYIYSEGSSIDGCKELLKEKLTGARYPVHVVSYNCTSPETISFMKNFCKVTGGRFHAYAVVMEMDFYEGAPVDPNNSQSNVILKRRTYGGVPPGAGMREDVIRLFEEIEEARSTLSQVQALIKEVPDPNTVGKLKDKTTTYTSSVKSITIRETGADQGPRQMSETYMSSREWIDRNGLKTKKLGFYDVLSSVAFKHRDGVVDLKHRPGNEEFQTDAVTQRKLVNAKYCDRFPHVRWKDGQVVHVQVTPELHRNYEQKMKLTLEAVQQRIDWLQQGSRELFGTVIEDQIYILIDTSTSMTPHIQFVKDKLFTLMQEQLRHKQRFNLVNFDSKSNAWRDRLVEVDEKNLHEAWTWIKGLTCNGSTNTMAALRHALSDHQTQAIYLLTDGRPDQPPRSILAQVQLHPQIPVHTISFNCSDKEANQFLCDLAKESGGRFHYYSESGIDLDGPEPWESEDIRLLRQELDEGYRNLERIAQLRDECSALSWKSEELKNSRDISTPTLPSKEMFRPSLEKPYSLLDRPQSAPGKRIVPKPPTSYRSPRQSRPSTGKGGRTNSPKFSVGQSLRFTPRMTPTASGRPQKAMSMSAPQISAERLVTRSYNGSERNVAGHTRTSILRALARGGEIDKSDWLLPETRKLFENQWNNQIRNSQETSDKTESPQRGRKKKKVPTATLR